MKRSRLPFEDYVAEIAAKPRVAVDRRSVARGQASSTSTTWTHRSAQFESEIKKLDAQLDQLSEGGDITLVSWEKPSLAYADVLTRGMYTARTERVEANTPHYLPPLPKDEPRNRLALAKWTVSPENPLTARVTVNRMWYELFGTGPGGDDR